MVVPFLMGLTSPNDWPYLLWSGVGSYILQAGVRLRIHNCHEPWCWRIGRFDGRCKHHRT